MRLSLKALRWARLGRTKEADVSPTAKTTPRRVAPRIILHFIFACVITYGGERLIEVKSSSDGQEGNLFTRGLFEVADIYHWLVTSVPRKPVPRFTTLITLSNDASPGISLFNVCRERQYLGEVLKSLSHLHPGVVLIDKYFLAKTCPVGDIGTKNLIDGVESLCREHTTIVVGRSISELDLRSRHTLNEYHLDDALSFGSSSKCVAEGIANVGMNLRRVDLWWTNIHLIEGSPEPSPSLTLAASIAASKTLLTEGRLAGWDPSWPSPYVSFVEPRQFEGHILPAKTVLCGGTVEWRACSDDELSESVRTSARNRIIVIGEDQPGFDRHETVVGDLPGYLVLANYIESLLDDRLIRPVPEWLNITTGFLIFVLFNYVLMRYHSSRGKALLLLLLLFFCAAAAIYLSIALLGFYLNPTSISIFAAGLRLADVMLMPTEPTSLISKTSA